MTTQSFKSRRQASSSRRLGFEVVARARLNLLVKVITLIRLITWGAPVLDWAEQAQSLCTRRAGPILLAQSLGNRSRLPPREDPDRAGPNLWVHLLDNRQGVIHARRSRVTQR